MRRYLWVVAAAMLLAGCASGLSSPPSSQADTGNYKQYQEQEELYDEGLQEAPPELPTQ